MTRMKHQRHACIAQAIRQLIHFAIRKHDIKNGRIGQILGDLRHRGAHCGAGPKHARAQILNHHLQIKSNDRLIFGNQYFAAFAFAADVNFARYCQNPSYRFAIQRRCP